MQLCPLPGLHMQTLDHACAGAGNVTQSVRLLEAETPLLQRSGASRVRLIAASGLAEQRLVDAGAPGKLLALLHPTGDPGAAGKLSSLWLVL